MSQPPWGPPQPTPPPPSSQPGPSPHGSWSGYTRPPETVRPSFQHAEPTPYHLMLRTWTYSAWRPVVGLLLLVLGMMIVVPVLMLPILLVGTAIESGAPD